jgi:hypothetical protein
MVDRGLILLNHRLGHMEGNRAHEAHMDNDGEARSGFVSRTGTCLVQSLVHANVVMNNVEASS